MFPQNIKFEIMKNMAQNKFEVLELDFELFENLYVFSDPMPTRL